MLRARVSKKGQVTLPAQARKHLNIKPKDYINFILEDRAVRIVPSGKEIEALKGIIKAEGPQDFKAARHRAMEETVRERTAKTARD